MYDDLHGIVFFTASQMLSAVGGGSDRTGGKNKRKALTGSVDPPPDDATSYQYQAESAAVSVLPAGSPVLSESAIDSVSPAGTKRVRIGATASPPVETTETGGVSVLMSRRTAIGNGLSNGVGGTASSVATQTV